MGDIYIAMDMKRTESMSVAPLVTDELLRWKLAIGPGGILVYGRYANEIFPEYDDEVDDVKFESDMDDVNTKGHASGKKEILSVMEQQLARANTEMERAQNKLWTRLQSCKRGRDLWRYLTSQSEEDEHLYFKLASFFKGLKILPAILYINTAILQRNQKAMEHQSQRVGGLVGDDLSKLIHMKKNNCLQFMAPNIEDMLRLNLTIGPAGLLIMGPYLDEGFPTYDDEPSDGKGDESLISNQRSRHVSSPLSLKLSEPFRNATTFQPLNSFEQLRKVNSAQSLKSEKRFGVEGDVFVDMTRESNKKMSTDEDEDQYDGFFILNDIRIRGKVL
jgi:hypothetical protein